MNLNIKVDDSKNLQDDQRMQARRQESHIMEYMSKRRAALALLIGILIGCICGKITNVQMNSQPISNMRTRPSNNEDDGTKDTVHLHPQLFVRQSDPLPPQINGTIRLVFISDTHGNHENIKLPDGDVLFHLGDACDRGNITQLQSFVQWMKQNSFKERIVIDGNHDFDRDPIPGQPIRDYMLEYKGVAKVLKNEVVTIANGQFTVLGVTWNACKSEDFTEAKNNMQTSENIDLVLSHYPPYVQGGGRGWEISRLLSQFVQDINPPLHCFGHIHYARGVRAFNTHTTMVNCATTWNEPVVIDYCPVEKRAVMIYSPIPDESLLRYHLGSSKFPKKWIGAEQHTYSEHNI